MIILIFFGSGYLCVELDSSCVIWKLNNFQIFFSEIKKREVKGRRSDKDRELLIWVLCNKLGEGPATEHSLFRSMIV